MPTYAGGVVWQGISDIPRPIVSPLAADVDAGGHNLTNVARIEAKHVSVASSGTVTLNNNNANVSSPTVSGDDIAGVVSFSFSGSIAANTQLTKVNFGAAYTSAPRVIVRMATAGSSGGAGVDYYVDSADVSTGGFFIRNETAISGSGSGKAAYIVIGAAGG